MSNVEKSRECLKRVESLKNEALQLLEEYKNSVLQQYRFTGECCMSFKGYTPGIVLKENEDGSIKVLENIQPRIIKTYDSWKELTLINEEEL